MRRTSIAYLLAGLFLLGFMPPPDARAEEPRPLMTSEGVTYLNMPLQTFGGKTALSSISFSALDIKGRNVAASGTLQVGSNSYPFSFVADLVGNYNEKLNKISIIPMNVTGEFDVLHASYSPSAVLETLPTKNERLAGRPVLSLYFKHKERREVAFFDIDLSAQQGISAEFLRGRRAIAAPPDALRNQKERAELLKLDENQLQEEEATATRQDPRLVVAAADLRKAQANEYWSNRLFEPIKASTREAGTRGPISCYRVVGCKDLSYAFVYEYQGNIPGQYIDEVIEWNFKLERFATTTFLGNITITRQYTDSNANIYDDPNFAPLTLGHYDYASGQITMSFKFNGSATESNPWGDSISKVRTYGVTSAESYPTALIKQFVKRGRNWVSAIYDTVTYLLSTNERAQFNGPDRVLYDTEVDANKIYSVQLEDRRMGSVGQSFTTEVYLKYRPGNNGNYARLTITFGVYQRDGWGFYNVLAANKSIYYDLWYDY